MAEWGRTLTSRVWLSVAGPFTVNVDLSSVAGPFTVNVDLSSVAGRSPSTSTFECSEGGSYMTRGRSAKANRSGFGFVEVYKVRDNVEGSI